MKDISLHLLDIVENSAKAGADCVDISFDGRAEQLTMTIADNGPGFPDTVSADPANPFKTTRQERPVGLGLALLKEAAEQSGGELTIATSASGGVALEARFVMTHIDAKPLGNLVDTLMTILHAWPELNIIVHLGQEDEVILDTIKVKQELGGISLQEPEVAAFLRQALESELVPLYEWIEQLEIDLKQK